MKKCARACDIHDKSIHSPSCWANTTDSHLKQTKDEATISKDLNVL